MKTTEFCTPCLHGPSCSLIFQAHRLFSAHTFRARWPMLGAIAAQELGQKQLIQQPSNTGTKHGRAIRDVTCHMECRLKVKVARWGVTRTSECVPPNLQHMHEKCLRSTTWTPSRGCQATCKPPLAGAPLCLAPKLAPNAGVGSELQARLRCTRGAVGPKFNNIGRPRGGRMTDRRLEFIPATASTGEWSAEWD